MWWWVGGLAFAVAVTFAWAAAAAGGRADEATERQVASLLAARRERLAAGEEPARIVPLRPEAAARGEGTGQPEKRP